MVVSALLTHEDPRFYADPLRFDPDRFLGAKPDTYQWVPFGGGTRRCIGAAFAHMEMDVVLRTLLERYDLALSDERDEGWRFRGVAFAPRARRPRGGQEPSHLQASPPRGLPSPNRPSEQYLDHHGRLLEGMAESVRERGLSGTTVADVVRIARVSRRTFYQHFDDLVDCYLELMRLLGDELLEAVREAMESGGTVEERIERAVGRYLDLLEEDPALARSFWLEYHLTGERGRGTAVTDSERAAELFGRLAAGAARGRGPAARTAARRGVRDARRRHSRGRPHHVRARPLATAGPDGDRLDGPARRYRRPSRWARERNARSASDMTS